MDGLQKTGEIDPEVPCEPAQGEEQQLQDALVYWAHKQLQLQSLLESDYLATDRFKTFFGKREGRWQIEVILEYPSCTLSSTASDFDPHLAIDRIAENLRRQILQQQSSYQHILACQSTRQGRESCVRQWQLAP